MKRLLAVVGVALTVLALLAPAATAADTVTIRRVDTTEFPKVKVLTLVTGETPRLDQFTLRENGQIVRDFDVVPIGKTNLPLGVVLVIDISGSMKANGAIDQAKAAAKQFVAQKQPSDEIAVVAFGSEPRVISTFTKDAAALDAAIDALQAQGETALWDGVRTAVGLYANRPELQANLVVLSDGKDTVSTTTFDQAKGAALSAKAVVFSVGLKGGDFDAGPVRSLAEATGGQYLETTDPKALSAAYASVQRSLQNQYEVTYQSAQKGTLDITVGVAGALATANGINTGTVSEGLNNQPEYVKEKPVPGVLKGAFGKWLVVLLVVAAAGLLAYGLILTASRSQSAVERALQPYLERGTLPDDDGGDGSLIETPILQRAVEATARVAEQRGILQRVEGMLERADLPLQASEALFFYLAALAIFTVLGLLLGGLFLGLVGLLVFALLPPAVLSFLSSRRQRKFTTQLPDTLQLLAGTLRAGYSLLQGVEAVAQEVDDPMGRELRRVLAEARLGRPLEEALEDCAERMGSGDFEWAVMAIRIQREVGGNLAELLDTVADTMLQRERLRREVRALTAEGRISAIILGLLPVGLGVVMYAINPDYMQPLFDESLGKALLIGSGLLALVGFYWMKKTIEIEV